MLKLGWIGFYQEGLPALELVLAYGAPVSGVITLTREAAARRSPDADYTFVCRRYGVPRFEVDDINDGRGLEILRDLAFVIRWTQLVRPPAHRLVRWGLIGAHASLLPQRRGRAPINWSLIRGETCTGNALLWLDESVDGGDVIDQTLIPITPYDTCAMLYAGVAESNRDMILRALPRLLAGERVGRRQPPSGEPLLPKRRPEHAWSTGRARTERSRTSSVRSPGRIRARSRGRRGEGGRSGTAPHGPLARRWRSWER